MVHSSQSSCVEMSMLLLQILSEACAAVEADPIPAAAISK